MIDPRGHLLRAGDDPVAAGESDDPSNYAIDL